MSFDAQPKRPGFRSAVSFSLTTLTVSLLLAAGLAPTATGQGTFGTPVVLDTRSGEAFLSAERELFVPAGFVNPALRMKVGFGTDEVFGPGGFLDSFTLTLQTADRLETWILATFDAGGPVWAPPTPGTTPLTEADVHRSAIDYPSLTPVLAQRWAYDLEVALPPSMVTGSSGFEYLVYFNLFSNTDGIHSEGWFADLTLVPEPGSTALGLTGALLLGAMGLQRRRR